MKIPKRIRVVFASLLVGSTAGLAGTAGAAGDANVSPAAVSLEASILRGPIPDKQVVLTFDDACISHFTFVGPLLKKYGFGGTFFVCEMGSQKDQKPEDYMSWPQIRQLHDMGFEIGSHTRNHAVVTVTPPNKLVEELAYIENKCAEFGIPRPVSFAYPCYSTSGPAITVLRERGYLWARTGGSPVYDPLKVHPLLIPCASTARNSPQSLKNLIAQAKDGKVLVLLFHGVPDVPHPWVSFEPSDLEACMQVLKETGCHVMAMRDLDRFVDSKKAMVQLQSKVPTTTCQYGAERREFSLGENRAFVILPTKHKADGTKPWIWFAPSFSVKNPGEDHAWMFTQLLESGFAIAGINVGESYGSPDGRAAYSQLYDHLVQKYGLSRKACLLPQSRGGLMLYNWAAENPEKVQCIGGIYTVGDLTSFPGLRTACAPYHLSEAELGAHLAEHNPIERLAPLAKERVPILHLHGDRDTLVPLEKNSGELVKRYQAMGGPGELIVIPGKGHQVCDEFFKSQRLVDFFLSQGFPEVRSTK